MEVMRVGRMMLDLFPNLHHGGMDIYLDFPVYYVNMDGDLKRRERMERMWGHVWDLRRQRGVDARVQQERVVVMGKGHSDEWFNMMNSDPDVHGTELDPHDRIKELGPSIAHLLAIKRAYDEGLDMAMFCEDDVTPFLIPYWTKSPRELISIINDHHNGSGDDWHILQLSNVEARGYDPLTGNREKWLKRVVGPLELHPSSVEEIKGRMGGQLLKEKYWWGAAAYIVSRKGMEYLVTKYFTKEGLIHFPLDSRNRVDVEVLPSVPTTYIASPALFLPDFSLESTLNSEVDRALKVHQKEWVEMVSVLSDGL